MATQPIQLSDTKGQTLQGSRRKMTTGPAAVAATSTPAASRGAGGMYEDCVTVRRRLHLHKQIGAVAANANSLPKV